MKLRAAAAWLSFAALVACAGPSDGAHDNASLDAGHAPDDPPVNRADAAPPTASEYPFELPFGFPKPYVPAANPLTAEKVELGRHLFYDVRLSANETQSCGSCHQQALAFTDGRPVSVGSTGQMHRRNAMSLTNVAYAATLTWPNPVLTDLEPQSGVPLFGIDPVIELGLKGHEEEALDRLRADTRYQTLFAAAFPGQGDPFDMVNVQRAIASFERTLVSGTSRFDRYQYLSDKNALTVEEKRGLELFGSEALECFHCHGGFNFTDAVVYKGLPLGDLNFHNTGLYNVDGKGAFPADNVGLLEFTAKPSDMGRFKAPTLRNIEKTAPYMHDGSIATLEEVIEHYSAGGRTITSGPHAGIGSANPFKSSFISGFSLTAADKHAVVAFLKSLTDDAFLTNPKLANPWSANSDAGAPSGP